MSVAVEFLLGGSGMSAEKHLSSSCVDGLERQLRANFLRLPQHTLIPLTSSGRSLGGKH